MTDTAKKRAAAIGVGLPPGIGPLPPPDGTIDAQDRGQLAGSYLPAASGGTDSTPDAFSFADQTGVQTSSVITSAPVTISGIDTTSAVSITGGEYSIDGGAWTSAGGSVTVGQQIRVRHTSSASYSTATNTALTVGGVSDTFTSTTQSNPGGGGSGTNIIILRRRVRR